MKFVTYLTSTEDLVELNKLDLAVKESIELLIEPLPLSKIGPLGLKEADELANRAVNSGFKTVLVWDHLVTESFFQESIKHFNKLTLENFSECRVFDPGVALWITSHTNLKLQLIFETGSHNLESLKGWEELFSPNLSKLVVSNQLPIPSLEHLCKHLKAPIEVLGAGRVELFYSPRKLLTPFFPTVSNNPSIEAIASSLESNSRPFPVVQSVHGTLMYLDKDRFLLDRIDELELAGVTALRVDLRHFNQSVRSAQLNRFSVKFEDNLGWPALTIAPFRHANNTLRSSRRIRAKFDKKKDSKYVAEVIATEKERYTVFRFLKNTDIGSSSEIENTNGEVLSIPSFEFKDVSTGKTVTRFSVDQLAYCKWIRKAGTGSLLRGQ